MVRISFEGNASEVLADMRALLANGFTGATVTFEPQKDPRTNIFDRKLAEEKKAEPGTEKKQEPASGAFTDQKTATEAIQMAWNNAKEQRKVPKEKGKSIFAEFNVKGLTEIPLEKAAQAVAFINALMP